MVLEYRRKLSMYTEQEIEVLQKYKDNPTLTQVRELAQELGKSPKSIIGKLSRLGIYKKIQYKSKTGLAPRTKLEIVASIETILDTQLTQLDKTPKQTLMKLEEALKD